MRNKQVPFIPTGELISKINLSMPERAWVVWTPTDILQTREQPAQHQPPRFQHSCQLLHWVREGAK